jgi:atypical dual specificity phosphatase
MIPTTSRTKKKPALTLTTTHTLRVDTDDQPKTPSLTFSDERFDSVINHVEDMTTITEDELYMGNSIAAKDNALLNDNGITLLINCTDTTEIHQGDIKYHAMNLKDANNEDIAQHFTATIAMISNEIKHNGRAFVYCTAGISRSVAIVIPYMMKEKGYTLREAFLDVQRRRPIIAPNLKYFAAMVQFEKDLYGKNTLSLYEYSLYYAGAATIDDLKQGQERMLAGKTPIFLKVNALMEDCGGDYDRLVNELLKLTGH